MKTPTRYRSVYACALVAALAAVAPAAVTFQVAYTDAAGTGYFDPQLGSARRAALQRALDGWSAVLADNAVIRLEAGFKNLGGTTSSATLGYGQPTRMFEGFTNAPAGVWYPSALADAIAGHDIKPGTADIVVVANADIDGPVMGDRDFHYGAEPASGGDIDFTTVVMHEIAHGLGFYSTFQSDGTYGQANGQPAILDTLLVGPDGLRLIDTPASSGKVTGDVYFDGEATNREWLKRGYGGLAPLYAPNLYSRAASLSHGDAQWFRGQYSLMNPIYDVTVRVPDNVTLGMLDDMGWTVAYPHAPEPGSALVLAVGSFYVIQRRRRHRSSRAC